MKHGKYQEKPLHGRKGKGIILPLVVVALVLSITAGGTLAYIIDNTSPVSNSFTPAQVSCTVNENLTITNNSNIPAYIRAMVVVNWVDSDGNVYGKAPVANADYTINYDDSWQEAGGIYYYSTAVAPNANLNFVTVVKNTSTVAPDGYTLTVEVIAEAIQAEGMGATSAQDAWAKAKTGS